MKAIKHVIVETGEPYERAIQYKSLHLEVDPEFNPTKYSKTVGKVISAPKEATDLTEGDIVFFHYGAIDVDKAGDGQYFIEYTDVFCKLEEDDKLKAVGNWVLCEPVARRIPSFTHMKKNNGRNLLISETSGIVIDFNWKEFLANVFKVISHPQGIMEGQYIICQKDSDFDNFGRTIMGKQYFYVANDLILAAFWDRDFAANIDLS